MKSIRKQLHLSQRDLAELLGVSITTLCYFEKGLRNLPAKAGLQLSNIQLQLQQNQRKKFQPDHKLQTRQHAHALKAEKKLKAYARKAAADAVHISITLQKMQERQQQLLLKMQLLQQLKQQALPATRQMSFLEVLEQNVIQGLDQCGPAQQLLAQYQLDVLKARQQAAVAAQVVLQQNTLPVKNS